MKKTALLLWLVFTCTTFPVTPRVLVITNPDTQLSTLDKKDVMDIFTGKRTRWNGSGKITLAILEDSELHREFLQEYVKKTPSQFKNYWRRKVFTGEGRIPRTFANEAELIDFITSTKGAVGYISGPTTKPVKVLEISDSKGGSR